MQRYSEKGKATTVYDIGIGMKVLSGLLFALVGVLPFFYLVSRARELGTFPNAVRNPIAALVVVSGGALFVWCIAFGLWVPLRSLFFPIKTEGTFMGFSVVEDANGRRNIDVTIGGAHRRARYNPVLVRALESLASGTTIRILYGSKELVTRIERL